jgi:hypothetical protein
MAGPDASKRPLALECAAFLSLSQYSDLECAGLLAWPGQGGLGTRLWHRGAIAKRGAGAYGDWAAASWKDTKSPYGPTQVHLSG